MYTNLNVDWHAPMTDVWIRSSEIEKKRRQPRFLRFLLNNFVGTFSYIFLDVTVNPCGSVCIGVQRSVCSVHHFLGILPRGLRHTFKALTHWDDS